MAIEVQHLVKTFGAFRALDDVSLTTHDGELLALLGPSGSGKTTLLRAIAGLETVDSGSIRFYGADVAATPVRERGVGFVFQHYALFRHMTVFENVAFGLRVRPRKERPSEARIRERVHELLNLVQLEFLADRYPSQLSGGQRQRIALARALAVEPKLLLLDEPFGALDAKVRKELRRWLKKMHRDMKVTTVFVTHDQDEALEVADRVVIMNHGRVEQIGAPDEVFDHPRSAFVMDFVGSVNLFHKRHLEDPAASTVSYVRPHEIHVERRSTSDADVHAQVHMIQKRGAVVRLELVRVDDGQVLEVELARGDYEALALTTGESVFVRPQRAHEFEEDFSI